MWAFLKRRVGRQIKRAAIRRLKRPGRVLLSDTTLRDGEQMPGVRLAPEDKLAIARALAAAGFHSIEAGFPAAAEEEVEAVRRIAREVRGPVITALARAIPGDIDRAAEALAEAPIHRRGISLFLGVSPQHRRHKHRRGRAETIAAAVEAVRYAKRRKFVIVVFGPEDASRAEPEFLNELYRETIAAGATTVGFADTVGILTPEKAAEAIRRIQDGVPELDRALLGVHFHDDLGLATANALACVAEGVNVVQGTINGIGERAGNTALEEVVVALHLHRDQYAADCGVDPRQLAGLSALVAERTGVATPPNKAVVGRNLFATGAGVHQDGLLKDPSTYLPFPPELVGAGPVRLVLGKHSGHRAVRWRLERHGTPLPESHVRKVVEHLKRGARRRSYETDEELEGLIGEVFGGRSQRDR